MQNKKFYLSLHYNRENSYLFFNGKEIHKLKAKDFEIVATPLCLGNILKYWSVDMKKTGLNGYVYDFSVDYVAITADGHLKLSNEKEWHSIIKCLGLSKGVFLQD